jgi:hypothetical protein
VFLLIRVLWLLPVFALLLPSVAQLRKL